MAASTPEDRMGVEPRPVAPARVLEAFLKNPGFTVVLLNADLTIEWVSASVVGLAGFRAEELIGQPALEFVHPDDLPEMAEVALHHVEHPEQYADGGPYSFMSMYLRLRGADGAWRQCEVFSTNHFLDPEVNGLFLLLRAAGVERAYEAVLDLLSEGVGLGVASGAFHSFLDQITGGSSAVLLGGPDDDLAVSSGTLALRDRDAGSGPWRRAVEQGRPVYVSEPPEVAALHTVTSTYENHHVLSYWAIPVIGASSGSVVGCLVVASPVGGTPRPWIQFWLGRATRLLALAVDRERSMAQLRRAAYEDSLTGVANRARLFAELEHRLIRSSVAVLFMDLDDLKGVNDTYGHAIGDEALVAAVRRIQSVVRPHDLVARMGGDEFVVACSDVHSITEAEVLAQRVVDAFADPFALGPHRVELGISIGVACSGGASSPSALVSRADAAMYAAKQAGKRRWRSS